MRNNENVMLTFTNSQIRKFNILENPTEKYYEVNILVLDFKEKEILVVLSIGGKEIELNYFSVNLSDDDKILLCWLFAAFNESDLFSASREQYKDKARELYRSISEYAKDNSCLPNYIYNEYLRLDTVELYELYKVAKCADTFPGFYHLIWRSDRNRIRSLGTIRDGVQKFPYDAMLVSWLAQDYFDKRQYDECFELVSVVERTHWAWYSVCISLGLRACLEMEKFDQAASFLIGAKISISEFKFFLGYIDWKRGNYEEAIQSFEGSIELQYFNDELLLCTLYLLLDCHLSLGYLERAITVYRSIVLKGSEEYKIDFFELSFIDDAIEIIKRFLKEPIQEILEAELKGHLGCLIYKKNFQQNHLERKLTKDEKKILREIIKYVENGLNFLPRECIFHFVYSECLRMNNMFDEAKKHALIVQCSTDDVICSVNFDECSESLINNYPEILKDLIDEGYLSAPKYMGVANLDIEDLFKKKKYKEIARLVHYLEEHGALTKDSSYTGYGIDTFFFEIAYSLEKVNQIKDSKRFYDFICSTELVSTSSLNNLALVCEKLEDKEGAVRAISRAKEMLKGEVDETIERNFNRIISLAPDHNQTVSLNFADKIDPPAQPPEKTDRELVLEWDGAMIIDSSNNQLSIPCRKGFPKALLSKCFENLSRPQYTLSREELSLSPKVIKASIKSLVTNWHTKFRVPRARIEKIISYKEGVVYLSPEFLKFAGGL